LIAYLGVRKKGGDFLERGKMGFRRRKGGGGGHSHSFSRKGGLCVGVVSSTQNVHSSRAGVWRRPCEPKDSSFDRNGGKRKNVPGKNKESLR